MAVVEGRPLDLVLVEVQLWHPIGEPVEQLQAVGVAVSIVITLTILAVTSAGETSARRRCPRVSLPRAVLLVRCAPR